MVPDFQPDHRLKVNDHELKLVAWREVARRCRLKVNDHELKLVAWREVAGRCRLKVNDHELKLVACGRFFRHALNRHMARSALVLIFSLWPAHLLAQQPATNEEIVEARAAASAERTAAAALPPATRPPVVQEPVNLGGLALRNTIEFGPRWRDVNGSEDIYRSHVNLGNGLKLYHSSSELTAPESRGRLFDLLKVDLDNWGGDPYNTATVRVKKNLAYDLEYRYQKIDYFNFIPEFANPLFDQGVLFGQHSFDTTRRMSHARLDLFPDAERFQAHLSYGRSRAFGPGFTTANLGGDEFVLGRLVKNSADDYRAGFDLRFWKLALSFEQGVRRFKDDEGQMLPGGFSLGNDPNPIFDFQPLFLTNFLRSYSVRGSIPMTRVALRSHRLPRVVFNVRLYRSDADVDADFSQAFSGVVLNRELGSFASDVLAANRADPSKPYTVADGTIRVAVTRRVAVMNTFRGSNFVISGTQLFREQATNFESPDDPPTTRDEQSYRRTSLRSLMNQLEGEVAITNNLIVRAGHRTHHRRAVLRQQNLVLDSIDRDEETTQEANTFLMGGSYRWRRFIRVALDYENGGYLTEFTGADTRDFQRGRLRVQFSPTDQWRFTAFGSVFDQTRPNRALAGDFTLTNQNRSRSGGFSVSWFSTERAALDLDYTRGHITAKINTVVAGVTNPLFYREDSHVLHAGVDLNLYKDIRVGFGYRLVDSAGSYPIKFQRPYARLSVPLHRVVSLNLDYQHYGYNEDRHSVQDYRANLLTTSLRLSF